MVKRVLFLLVYVFCVIFLSTEVFALGVSPGKISMDFVPGYINTFEYNVKNVPSNSDINISLEGNLSKYASLDKNYLDGGGSFSLTLELPEKIETPGKNKIYVVVEEIPKKDEFGGMVGTSVTLKVLIEIFVPYPGKYLEIENFKAENVNHGEPVLFKASLVNKGKENLSVSPTIEITDLDGELVKMLSFGQGIIEVSEGKSLEKKMPTESFNPGEYNALLVADYGEKSAKKTVPFKIGNLTIDILNYTKKYMTGEGLKRFDLEIQSGWNNEIDGAYADIIISNETKEITSFKTSTTGLSPWENETIEGYINTSKFSPGNYNAEVTLNYYGKDVGKSKTETFDIVFVENKEETIEKIVFILGIVLVISLVVLVFIKVYLRKNNKGKNKKSKK